jgi:hypothetical protein
MSTPSLSALVATLTPDEEAAVREFIAYLRQQDTSFSSAAAEFIEQHAELLRRFSQKPPSDSNSTPSLPAVRRGESELG